MKAVEKIKKIDEAIDYVLSNLTNGIEIKEYEIDNVKIVKRSPLELINELRKIKKAVIKDAHKTKTQEKYVFSGAF